MKTWELGRPHLGVVDLASTGNMADVQQGAERTVTRYGQSANR